MMESKVLKLALLLLLAIICSRAEADVGLGPRRAGASNKARSITRTSSSSTRKTAAVSATSALTRRSSSSSTLQQQHDEESSPSATAAQVALELRGGVVSKEANTLPIAIAGTAAFAVIEKLVKLGLARADIKFPGQLGACIALFAALCLLDLASPSTAVTVFDALTPGATLLAKWLPVFFVPGLALLPISKSIPGTLDIVKIVFVAAFGLVYTLLGTVAGVSAVQTFLTSQGWTAIPAKPLLQPPQLPWNLIGNNKPTAVRKPFTEAQWKFCWMGTLVTGLVSIMANKLGWEYSGPLQALFMGFGTVGAYIWGARLPDAFVSAVHPLVSSSIVLLVLTQLLAKSTGQDFADVLGTYKQGTLHPLQAGAADYFFYILGPSVVSFAMSMYSRRKLLFGNLPMVLTASILSSAGGLFATAVVVRLLQIGGSNGTGASKVLRLSCLARNVTTALALVVTEIVGGDLSLVAAVVCVTGILGASYGKKLLDAAGITDPILRGLGIGSSAQGLGVAAMSDEPDAFPFAAIAMVLNAIMATILVSVPPARKALIELATGAAAP